MKKENQNILLVICIAICCMIQISTGWFSAICFVLFLNLFILFLSVIAKIICEKSIEAYKVLMTIVYVVFILTIFYTFFQEQKNIVIFIISLLLLTKLIYNIVTIRIINELIEKDNNHDLKFVETGKENKDNLCIDDYNLNNVKNRENNVNDKNIKKNNEKKLIYNLISVAFIIIAIFSRLSNAGWGIFIFVIYFPMHAIAFFFSNYIIIRNINKSYIALFVFILSCIAFVIPYIVFPDASDTSSYAVFGTVHDRGTLEILNKLGYSFTEMSIITIIIGFCMDLIVKIQQKISAKLQN